MKPFPYDEIGYWSEIKLHIVRKYATAYSTIMTVQPAIKKHIYVDAFAGAGRHIARRTGEFVPGSPLNALEVTPHFSEIHLIDLDGDKLAELRRWTGSRHDVFIYEADANEVLLNEVFPRCRYQDFNRALCLLDPYGLNVDWRVLQVAGEMGSVEVFYSFMIMDANRNVLWHKPGSVPASQAKRMDRVWGDHSWAEAAYAERPTLWGDTVGEKTRNEAIAEAFRKRLENVAGFKYVPKPAPMANVRRAVIYYLFFASPNETGARIVEDIFNTARSKGIG
ncbi:MAG: three-Cys-motif partner protein TcmP [Dehalococcoidia bacterium]